MWEELPSGSSLWAEIFVERRPQPCEGTGGELHRQRRWRGRCWRPEVGTGLAKARNINKASGTRREDMQGTRSETGSWEAS